MNLTPLGHNALGRTGFMIHGNNVQDNASQGCVILDQRSVSKLLPVTTMC